MFHNRLPDIVCRGNGCFLSESIESNRQLTAVSNRFKTDHSFTFYRATSLVLIKSMQPVCAAISYRPQPCRIFCRRIWDFVRCPEIFRTFYRYHLHSICKAAFLLAPSHFSFNIGQAHRVEHFFNSLNLRTENRLVKPPQRGPGTRGQKQN